MEHNQHISEGEGKYSSQAGLFLFARLKEFYILVGKLL